MHDHVQKHPDIPIRVRTAFHNHNDAASLAFSHNETPSTANQRSAFQPPNSPEIGSRMELFLRRYLPSPGPKVSLEQISKRPSEGTSLIPTTARRRSLHDQQSHRGQFASSSHPRRWYYHCRYVTLLLLL